MIRLRLSRERNAAPPLVASFLTLDLEYTIALNDGISESSCCVSNASVQPAVRLQEMSSGSSYKNSSKNRDKMSLVFGHV